MEMRVQDLVRKRNPGKEPMFLVRIAGSVYTRRLTVSQNS